MYDSGQVIPVLPYLDLGFCELCYSAELLC